MICLALASPALTSPALAGELKKAKAEFSKQDRELNQVYSVLRNQLPAPLFNVLRDEQRAWIGYRDYMSDWQAFGKEPATTADCWDMAAGITESRIEWLIAWTLRDKRKAWSGRYIDSHGGRLSIMEKDGQLLFRVSVVRGPTFHLGTISGELKVKDSKASHEVRVEPDAKLTRITITSLGDGSGRLKLEGENTQWFHGARAYFDGKYIWAGELTEEEKKAVLAEEPL